MEVTVYIDVLFALNFLMNLVLLFLTAIAVRLHISLLRMTAAAALLAMYGVLAVFPVLSPIASMTGKVAVTVPAILLLCYKESRRLQVKTWGVFWLIAVAAGGMMFALSLTSSHAVFLEGSLYLDVSLSVILTGIGAVYLLILGFCRLCEQRHGRKNYIIPFALFVNGSEVWFEALLDTGCELTVPGLGDAMLLVSKNVLTSLPKETFPVIIATAAGNKEIPAFYPEKLICLKKEYRICGIPAVGMTEETLSGDGQYQAVFNPAMLELGGEENEKPIGRMVAKDTWIFQAEKRRKRALHRGERDLASAPDLGGGAGTFAPAESAGAKAGDPASVD